MSAAEVIETAGALEVPRARVVELEEQRGGVVEKIEALVVASQADLERGGELVHAIDALVAEVNATFDPVVKAAHAAHKAATAARGKHLGPLEDAKRLVRRKMGDYVTEQERLAREKQIEAERAAKAEAEARALEEAAALEAQGDDDGAARVLAEAESGALPIATPPTAPAVGKVAGIAMRETWHAEVTDLRKLAAAVGSGHAPATLIEATKELQAFARATRGEVKIDGVRFFPRRDVASTGKR